MDKIDLLLPDGGTYQIDNKPGLTYIIGPNGTGKSYALKRFARENLDEALYILPTRDDVRRNLAPVVRREEEDFFREWLVYDQICRYWNRAVKQPGLLALAFSFLERLGVPQRVSVSVEDGEVKFCMSGEDGCNLPARDAPGLLNLPLLGIAVYDPERKLVIIDEPEQSLHPQAQHIFVQVLREVARLQDKHFILITHSPSMVDLRDAKDLARMVFFRRPKNYLVERKVFQLSPEDAGQYADLLPSLTTYKREVLFADKVILVEGQHDRDVLTALIESGGFRVSLARTSVLPLGGVGYMARYTAFFKEIGVKPFVICDRDVVYPTSAIRWYCGRMEGDSFDWRGWVSLSKAKAHARGLPVADQGDRPSWQPGEFDILDRLAGAVRKLMKRALERVEEFKDELVPVESMAGLLGELHKKCSPGGDYREYRAYHLLLSVALGPVDWQKTPVADIFSRLREAYEQLAEQADRLDILILRSGRLEDIYIHSGRQDWSKTEKSLREAADIRTYYQGRQEQIDVDYAELIEPLLRKRFIMRLNNGIPHEAAAVLSGKIHEIYDFLFGAGELFRRIQRLENSGKLEEISPGARVVSYDTKASPPEVTIQIPLLKGYLSPDGSITLKAGVRPEVFNLLYQGPVKREPV
ncbi:ATP-dependent nuclease [Desulfallas thermosapovorans]|uniref:Putative AbiEii toxin of type IV toxin-antitoxin system n=1 Tax=Desulfallas thermosapovorans DSM 6562 TaxID=1121431 RepID=A0A5S4ZRR5_9FIRM|nr:AAA family ATPase [Desulfallas thermosapovorans]TYO94712.1 putative AbiEii toxin of type IV toxin-antitoxin system [Desulfallas thermosapovorans DSM 6562]